MSASGLRRYLPGVRELSAETFNVSQGEQAGFINEDLLSENPRLKAAEFEFEWFGTSKLLSDRKARLMARSLAVCSISKAMGKKDKLLSLPEKNVAVLPGKTTPAIYVLRLRGVCLFQDFDETSSLDGDEN